MNENLNKKCVHNRNFSLKSVDVEIYSQVEYSLEIPRSTQR